MGCILKTNAKACVLEMEKFRFHCKLRSRDRDCRPPPGRVEIRRPSQAFSAGAPCAWQSPQLSPLLFGRMPPVARPLPATRAGTGIRYICIYMYIII